jgi:hypothetical protein
MHPAAAIRHGHPIARCSASGLSPALLCVLQPLTHGVDPFVFCCTPPPLDVADNGLTTLMHMHMLDGDFLLTLTPVRAIQNQPAW